MSLSRTKGIAGVGRPGPNSNSTEHPPNTFTPYTTTSFVSQELQNWYYFMVVLDGEATRKKPHCVTPRSNSAASSLPGKGLVLHLKSDLKKKKAPPPCSPLCWASWLHTLNSGMVHRYQVSAPQKSVSVPVN